MGAITLLLEAGVRLLDVALSVFLAAVLVATVVIALVYGAIFVFLGGAS